MADSEEVKDLQPKSPWAAIRHVRLEWMREKHGKTVKPQNEQTSNQHLTDAQVMQKRDEPIGTMSTAKPLSPGENRGVDGSYDHS